MRQACNRLPVTKTEKYNRAAVKCDFSVTYGFYETGRRENASARRPYSPRSPNWENMFKEIHDGNVRTFCVHVEFLYIQLHLIRDVQFSL